MKPTDKEIKEFWEWCGFEMVHHNDLPFTIKYAMFGTQRFDKLPPIDLNNLFKYAVPKVQPEWELGMTIDDTYRNNGMVRVVLTHITKGTHGAVKFFPLTITKLNIDPALALFWAIYEVMKCQHGQK